ncbi:hypothetical protein L2E82_29654 [Cichorium intybus]|uniref:Uncharacterized protein n=1 Tax=Cichorium intybus TaxID=13427 RepID=A0ACB9CYC9_CICIN|nr:hypothetical protein L2E82_29654 [Cichorium intybus]
MTGGDAGSGDKNTGGQINHDSPYYLHPSDYPRQVHVNDLLTDSNYIDRSQEVINFLLAKNMIGFVDGTVKKPEDKSPDYMPWMRCDAMVKGWLNAGMEKELKNSIKYAKTAEEIWSDMKERFAKESAPRAYELKQNLTLLRQDGTSVSTYYTKLKVLWDGLQFVLPTPRCSCNRCTCDVGKRLNETKENEKLYEFLLGLDSEFSTIRTQILGMTPTPMLGNAYHLVSEDEQQRSITAGKKATHDASAFQASSSSKRSINQRAKPMQKDNKGSSGTTEYCTHCNRDGHNREGCFKLIGYPEWWPGKKGEKSKPKAAACFDSDAGPISGLTKEQYEQFISLFGNGQKSNEGPVANMIHTPPTANNTGKINIKDNSVVDSGAMDHITHMVSILENKTKNAHEFPVIIPNVESVPVKGRGDHTLYNGTKIQGLLHVPDFNCNLLSISKLSKELQCTVTFFPDFFYAGLTLEDVDWIGEGIILETTCPHTPQQNVVVERKHKHLLETKIIVSRDVKFIETIFPYKNMSRSELEEEIFQFPIHWDTEAIQRNTPGEVQDLPNQNQENETQTQENEPIVGPALDS